MNKNEFRSPLLQSAVVIVVLLVLVSFVVTSGAEGFGSGLAAIISGIVYSVLFTLGLIVSILLSISLLILLFLAAVALYSVDKAKELFVQLQSALLGFSDYLTRIITHRGNNRPDASSHDRAKIEYLENELAQAAEQNQQLRSTISSLTREIETLRSSEKADNSDRQSPPPAAM